MIPDISRLAAIESGEKDEQLRYRSTSPDEANRTYEVIVIHGSDHDMSCHYRNYDGKIYPAGIELSDIAWHCGNWNMCMKSIAIDIGNDVLDEDGEASLANVVQKLQQEYSIPAEKVIRHKDKTGKECPAQYSDEEWLALKQRICL